MADFSHHSLLLKAPTFPPHQMEHDLTNASFDLPSFLFYTPSHIHDHATPTAAATILEEASLETSSVVLDTPPHVTACVDKKRKNREDSASLSSAHSKDSKETKNRRAKRPNKEVEEKSEQEEAPKGYIHVRARRGQATDSHSLAERVRRERISERMRMLQALVPGCDKVTGKALILDEIINYVQSLQNQVEFLSMRIASMSPVLYGFGLDSDALNDQTQKIGGMFQETLPMPSVLSQTASPAPSQAIMDNTSTTSYSLQGQEAISFSQDNASYLMQTVGEPRQELLNQLEAIIIQAGRRMAKCCKSSGRSTR